MGSSIESGKFSIGNKKGVAYDTPVICNNWKFSGLLEPLLGFLLAQFIKVYQAFISLDTIMDTVTFFIFVFFCPNS